MGDEQAVQNTAQARVDAADPVGAADPVAAGQLAVVNRALDSLRDVDDAPLAEHAGRYRAVHSALQGALSDTDLHDSG